ncbi:NAD(P)H-dependent oxidoreductase [Bacillus sp. MUM 116]|nr:NAD(P)H-dependent oxidoreductase [Bacillus sp. MUM 116]
MYAHPNTRSLNYAILENVIKGLNDANQKFEVVHLYEEKFDPVL